MKLNKKFVAINVLATLLSAETAMARIEGVRSPVTREESSDAGRPGKGTPTKTSTATKEEAQKILAVNEAKCSGDQDTEKYFPQALFSQLTRDGDGLTIEKRPNNKIVVKIPPILNVCGDFVPELKQNKDTKNVSILMKLIGTRKEKVVVNGAEEVKETKNAELTYKEFEDCLKEEKILVNEKINHDGIPGKKYTSNVYSMDYDFDKKKDIQKSVTINFAYPNAYSDPKTGYDPLFGFDEKSSVPGEACMLAEKISDVPVYINKGRDVYIEEINTICKNGTAQEIANARNTLGNADALKDIADKIKEEMDAGYLTKAKAEVEEIYKKMKKLEDKLGTGKDSLDEKAAKKVIAEYAEEAKKLNRTFLSPAIYRLDTLMQKRSKIEDEDAPELKAIDSEIKKLNTDIRTFAKDRKDGLTSVYYVMEKYATNEDAKVIEDVYQTSSLYGSVYAGRPDERGKPKSFEVAARKQEANMKVFDKVLTDWSDVYQVGKGNMFPIKKVEKERQNTIDRMNSRYAAYEKKEYSDYQNYCGIGMLGSVKNPVKCKEFVSGMDKRRSQELKKREKDLMYIKGKNETLGKMGNTYNEYTRKMASEEQGDPDNRYDTSSYSNYEESFSERFPAYAGPNSSTTYDASMYNMGGVSNSMSMGQQQMMMPQMQQQQGYQYQMPQMQQQQQMGSWPSIQ